MFKRSDSAKYEHLHGQVFPQLAGAVDGSAVLNSEEQSHVETCPLCQAEIVHYRKMLRALHDLRTTVIRPAPGLLADVLENLAERGEQKAIRSLITGKRAAYAGGIAVATVAGVAGVVILAGRGRKPVKKAA
jgi:hypothetical protein